MGPYINMFTLIISSVDGYLFKPLLLQNPAKQHGLTKEFHPANLQLHGVQVDYHRVDLPEDSGPVVETIQQGRVSTKNYFLLPHLITFSLIT